MAVGITTDYNRSCWNLLWAMQTATERGVPLLNLSAQCKGFKRQAGTSPQFYLWLKKTFWVRHLYTIVYMIRHVYNFRYKNIYEGKLQTSQYPVSNRGQKQCLKETMRLVKTRSHTSLASCSLLLRDFKDFLFNTSNRFLFAEFVWFPLEHNNF